MSENIYHKICADILESNKNFLKMRHDKKMLNEIDKQKAFKKINEEIRKHKEQIFEEEEFIYDEYEE